MNGSLFTQKEKRDRKPDNPLLKLIDGFETGIAEHVVFLRAFLREPGSVGAVSPSSRMLAHAMIETCALEKADTVVELGPGTGAFTGLIRNRLPKHATFFALELDASHVSSLKQRFPELLVYNDSAERIMEYLVLHRRRRADCIISGIPWANLPSQMQSRLMDAILAALAPDGVFTTFAYFHARWLPKARSFRENMESRFARVDTSPVVWRNLPPAFVYRCSR